MTAPAPTGGVPLHEALTRRAGVLPVPVEAIARDVGIELRAAPAGDPALAGEPDGRIERRADGGWRMVLREDATGTRRRHTVATLVARRVYLADVPACDRLGAAHRGLVGRVAANLLMPAHLVEGLGETDVPARAALLGVTPAMLRVRCGLPAVEAG